MHECNKEVFEGWLPVGVWLLTMSRISEIIHFTHNVGIKCTCDSVFSTVSSFPVNAKLSYHFKTTVHSSVRKQWLCCSTNLNWSAEWGQPNNDALTKSWKHSSVSAPQLCEAYSNRHQKIDQHCKSFFYLSCFQDCINLNGGRNSEVVLDFDTKIMCTVLCM